MHKLDHKLFLAIAKFIKYSFSKTKSEIIKYCHLQLLKNKIGIKIAVLRL